MAHFRSSLSAVAMMALLLLALGIRLVGLDRRTLTHPEAYVPRIAYPDYATSPPARHTLDAVMWGTWKHDNHPPGYYVGMLVWTWLVGTELTMIRLPSALAGAALVVAVWMMANRREGQGAALLSCALVALHGHHVFWSQQARMWVFIPLLVTVSVVLLERLLHRWSTIAALTYVVAMGCALWTEFYAWLLLPAQVTWLLVRTCPQKRIHPVLILPFITVMLSSPVLLMLRHHLEFSSYVGQYGGWQPFWRLLALGNLLPSETIQAWLGPASGAALAALAVVGTGLILRGIQLGPSSVAAPNDEQETTQIQVWLLAVLTAFSSVLCILMARHFHATGRNVSIIEALPALILGTYILAARSWPVWSRWVRMAGRFRLVQRVLQDAASAHLVIPLALLVLAAVRYSRFADRALLLLLPFLLVLAARALVAMRGGVSRGAAVGLAILACAASVQQYAAASTSPIDYQSLANAMRPYLHDNDLVLLEDRWWVQPMHYYLRPGQVATCDTRLLMTTQAPDAPMAPQDRRLWVIEFGKQETPKPGEGLRGVPAGWTSGVRLSATGCAAVLYERHETEHRKGDIPP